MSLLLLPAMLISCGDQSSAEKAVRAILIDPDSAKFGDFTKTGIFSCLTVNSRNRMGGYTGDSQAYLVKDHDIWSVVKNEEETHDSCKSSIAIMQHQYEEKVKFCEDMKGTIDDKAIGSASKEMYDASQCNHL